MKFISECQIVELIRTTLERRGAGIPGDPVHIVVQYWTKKGELVFEFDKDQREPEGLNF